MQDPALITYLESLVSPQRLCRFDEVLKNRTNFITVVMEDVYHLHNASAVIRTADVFGIQEIHVIESRFKKRLDKKIALGAQKWTDIHRYKNTGECVDQLKKNGYRLFATTPHAKACPLHEIKITQKSAFLFGAEKEGLSDMALEEADEMVHIPMVGFTESLNVSVAAAIVLQYTTSQLSRSQLEWQLTDAQKISMKLEWTKKSIKNIDQVLRRYDSGK